MQPWFTAKFSGRLPILSIPQYNNGDHIISVSKDGSCCDNSFE